MPLQLGIRRVGTDTLTLGTHSQPVGLSLPSDSLTLMTGPQMAAAVTDPELLTWIVYGFDLGAGMGLATANCTTDVACEVQYRYYNPVSKNTYLSARTALGTAHNNSVFITNLADRGTPLQFSWRWWYDGRISDGPYILIDSNVVIPTFGGDPTTNP